MEHRGWRHRWAPQETAGADLMEWGCRRGQRVGSRTESHTSETSPMLQHRLRFLVPLTDQVRADLGSRFVPEIVSKSLFNIYAALCVESSLLGMGL